MASKLAGRDVLSFDLFHFHVESLWVEGSDSRWVHRALEVSVLRDGFDEHWQRGNSALLSFDQQQPTAGAGQDRRGGASCEAAPGDQNIGHLIRPTQSRKGRRHSRVIFSRGTSDVSAIDSRFAGRFRVAMLT